MDFGASTIVSVIIAIRNQVNVAKGNSQTCIFLLQRIELLIPPLNSLDLKNTKSDTILVQKQLNNLHSIIVECSQFIETYGGQGWKLKLNRLFDANSIKSEFESLNRRLSEATNDLNLGIQINDSQILDAVEAHTNDSITFLRELAEVSNTKFAEIQASQESQASSINRMQKLLEAFILKSPEVLQNSNDLLVLACQPTEDVEIQSSKSSKLQTSSAAVAYDTILRRINSDFISNWNGHMLNEAILIGTGSFGKVYLCKYDGVDVALKHFTGFHSFTPNDLKSIRREALIMQRCNHINIISFIGVDLEKGILITQLAFCSFHSVLYDPTKKPLPIPITSITKMIWNYQVLCGLRFLHFHGIVHRDLKPANVLLVQDSITRSFIAKIADFGVSTSVGLTSTRGTKTSGGGAVGTSVYMAPELFDSNLTPHQMYSSKVDIYAYGIMANEMMTGRIPWEGLREVQIIGNVFYQSKRPNIFHPTTPEEEILGEIIGNASTGCLHQDRYQRPEASAVCDELKTKIPAVMKSADEAIEISARLKDEDIQHSLQKVSISVSTGITSGKTSDTSSLTSSSSQQTPPSKPIKPTRQKSTSSAEVIVQSVSVQLNESWPDHFGKYVGLWSDCNRDYLYQMIIDGKHLQIQGGGDDLVTLMIKWKILRAPRSSPLYRFIGEEGQEIISGRFDRKFKQLTCTGIELRQKKIFLGLDSYRMTVSEDNNELYSLCRGDAGTWKNLAYLKLEKDNKRFSVKDFENIESTLIQKLKEL